MEEDPMTSRLLKGSALVGAGIAALSMGAMIGFSSGGAIAQTGGEDAMMCADPTAALMATATYEPNTDVPALTPNNANGSLKMRVTIPAMGAAGVIQEGG